MSDRRSSEDRDAAHHDVAATQREDASVMLTESEREQRKESALSRVREAHEAGNDPMGGVINALTHGASWDEIGRATGGITGRAAQDHWSLIWTRANPSRKDD